MLNTTRAHHGNRPCCAGRRIAATATFASVCGCALLMFAVAPAQAQQLAVISPGFPLVNATTGSYAISIAYAAQVNAFNTVGQNNDSETFYPLDHDEQVEVPSVESLAISPVNSISSIKAIAHQTGHGGGGMIGGYVDVTVVDGPANSSTDIVINFIDKIHMSRDNQIDISPHLTGVAEKFTADNSAEFVNTSAQFDSYFFSAVNDPPAAGVAFRPAYHGTATETYTGETITETPNTMVFPAGSDWWVVGRLELRATGNLPISTDFGNYPGVSLFAIGDFEHTAFINLDAAPDGQVGPAFTSASGIDYSSAALVPEPAAFTTAVIAAVIAAVAAAVLHRRRRTAAHLCV